MSQPVLSGERLEVDTTGGILRVTNDPGFTSENGDGCPYRAVSLTGPVSYGRMLPKTTRPFDRWAGYFGSRRELGEWRLPITAGTYTLVVYGGTYFQGWGDHPDDAIEWGSDDQGKNPSGVPRVNAVTFTVSPPTPPPDGPTFGELRAHAVGDLERAVGMVAKPRSSAPAVYYAYRILTATPEERKAAFLVLDRVFQP